jgi:DNA invertase Pin-like site-specific DNA recombinase
MMIAAIYARKSTDQSGVADDQKSVRRQVENARAYATKKGWTVDERFVFVDDNISGSEFDKRPGFLRLMNSLKPSPSSACSSCRNFHDWVVSNSKPATP